MVFSRFAVGMVLLSVSPSVTLCIVALRVSTGSLKLYRSVPRRAFTIISSDTFAVGCIV